MNCRITLDSRQCDYLLGSSDAEHQRLIRQAIRLAPVTESFFREAGIGPGQRVLDLGSGVGDVAMLVAQLVGPSGEVVAIDHYRLSRRVLCTLRCAFRTFAPVVCRGFAASRSRRARRREHRNGTRSSPGFPGRWAASAQHAFGNGTGSRSGLHPMAFRCDHQYPSAD